MDKKFTGINVEDELWRRYDECYQCAKFTHDSHAMIAATDRMAALLGVTFEHPEDEDYDE